MEGTLPYKSAPNIEREAVSMNVRNTLISAALLGSTLFVPMAARAQTPATPAVAYAEGFQTPESVLYDAGSDTYLVSNINGSPLEADNNGFISRLAPDGKVLELRFIEGGKNGVTLNAPKGMTIAKGVLYVADLDTVRKFDAKTGKPVGEVKVEGATFLNDMARGPDNKVYVSDSGLKGGANGFEPSGTDAVYVLEGKKAKAVAKGDTLGRPNGLLVDKAGVHVVTFGSGEVYTLDAKKGEKRAALKLPKGALDGIEPTANGLLISSWEGEAVYLRKPDGSFTTVLSGLKAPADIGFDSKRNRVLVPRFMDNKVEAYDVK
jgi:sugar lactone lactonase YvrE